MDKQKNEEIYKQKRITLCVIPLCIIAARWVFRFAQKYIPTGKTLVGTYPLEWHYEWYYYALSNH